MPYVFGLLIATLLGADAKPAPAPEAPEITYQFKILDMQGLDWRTSLSSKLQPINRLGGATVWSAPGEIVPTLVRKADKVVAAPKVSSYSDAPAHFNCTKTATNPSGDSHSLVSFAPVDEKGSETRVGVCMTVRGRKIDQGVLTCMVISDKQVTAVHPVKLAGPGSNEAMTMVPEMSQCEIAGEWLIPNGGALVVSLGVHTSADAEGKAVVRERLAVVEAYRCEAGPEVRAVYEPSRLPSGQATRPIAFKGYINVAPKVTTSTITLPVPLPAAPTPTVQPALPVMPSRSLPEGRDADGQPVPLPPLPEITPMTTLPGTSTPCATPQGKPTEPYSRARPSGNSGDIRFFAPVATSVEEDAACPADPTSAFPASVSKTFSFRLPIGGGIEIEINAVAKSLPPGPKAD